MPVANDPLKKARPVILLIAGDGDVHATLKRNLRRHGYGVLLAMDVEDAIEWIGDGYIHADLILVDFIGMTTDEALRVGREVREHAKYDGHTPLVVMAETYGKDVEGTDVNVEGQDWIHYGGEKADQLTSLLARLTAKAA